MAAPKMYLTVEEIASKIESFGKSIHYEDIAKNVRDMGIDGEVLNSCEGVKEVMDMLLFKHSYTTGPNCSMVCAKHRRSGHTFNRCNYLCAPRPAPGRGAQE